MKFVFLIVLTSALVGCTGHHKWEVGDSTMHLLTYEGLAGPNVSSLWRETEAGVEPVYNASGTGLAPAMVTGGAQVGSAYFIGKGLGDSGDRTTNSNSNSNAAKSKARATNEDGDVYNNNNNRAAAAAINAEVNERGPGDIDF